MYLSYLVGAQCLALKHTTNEPRPVPRPDPLIQLSHTTGKVAGVCMSAGAWKLWAQEQRETGWENSWDDLKTNKRDNVLNNLPSRRVFGTYVAVNKQYVLHILSVCLQPNVYSMQRAWAVFSSVTWSALRYFSILSHKRQYLKKMPENVFWFSLQIRLKLVSL